MGRGGVTLQREIALSAHVLHVSATFHGRTVEDWFVPEGHLLQLGRGDVPPPRGTRVMEVPVPEGSPWLARVLFREGRWRVQRPDGEVLPVEAEAPVRLSCGEVQVVLAVARRLPLRRLELPSIQGSLAWLSLVVMAALVAVQAAWVSDHLCTLSVAYLPRVEEVGGPILWATAPALGLAAAIVALVIANDWRSVRPALVAPALGLVIPLGWEVADLHYASGEQFLAGELAFCIAQQQDGASGHVAAEYLARLLRKDLEGEDQGVVEDRIERPEAERELAEHQVFMPAGAPGPITRMGGAAERTLRPVRTLVVEEELAVPKKSQGAEPKDPGPTPAPAAEPTAEPAAGKEQGLEVEATAEAEAPPDAPSEEVEGWGIPGWYDERDLAVENLEIDLMLRVARSRLRIDPDDLEALGILSYYQYLAQDYKAALRTYDRMIELYPEDAAAYNNKALVYKREGDYRKEEGLYRQALSLEPLDETALNNLAVNLAHQGRFDEALAIMKDLETIDPDDPYADLHRSKIHAEMGHDEEAYRFLDKALAGMAALDTLHHIEFRQDIRLDPSFAKLRETARFRQILIRYYGEASPLEER